MSKIITILTISMFSICSSQAQKGVVGNTAFSVGVEAGVPVGTEGITLFYPIAAGGSLQVEHLVAPDLGLTFKAGFLNYFAIKGGEDFGMVPVLAGFRYRFSPRIYGSAQLGASFSTVRGEGAFFSYSPGIGLMMSHHFDLLARYEAASKGRRTYGNIGGRLAYNFE